VDVNTGVVEGSSDQYQMDIEFEKDGDGRLAMAEAMVFRSEPLTRHAVKIREGKLAKGNDLIVDRQWHRYKLTSLSRALWKHLYIESHQHT
jgi:hypothetical protein